MDNSVEKYVDKFEDNCVENNQKLEDQSPQWVKTWAELMLQHSAIAPELREKSTKLIEDIMVATLQGDSCLAKEAYLATDLQDLVVDDQHALDQVAPFVVDEQYFYLYRYWKLEQRLAEQIQRLKQQQLEEVDVSAFDYLLEDPFQKAALEMVAKQTLNIITGGPGTGKTYTLARIIAVLNQATPDLRVAMAAPTGKAAQRMKEALQASLNDPKLNEKGLVSDRLKNQDTLTIHRLLGLGTQATPRFHQKQPLPYDVIVIDEASMLDLNLATLLLEAVPEHCRLILLGDANQLASVDVGSVLADLQQVTLLQDNHVNLVTSRRFKDGALIGEMAQFIQRQSDATQSQETLLNAFEQQVVGADQLKSVSLQPKMSDLIQLEYLPDHIQPSALPEYYAKLSWGFHAYFAAIQAYIEHDYAESDIEKVLNAFDDYRILTAIRHGVFGVQQLNIEMQKILLNHVQHIRQQGDWYIGRPVMMTYNDYQLGLSNGDIGICFKHRTQAHQFEVFFASLNKWVPATRLPKSIQTAFVLTIHKSQGSEFQHTAVVLDQAATKLLSQELIYTAITRAKSVVSLLVSPQAFAQSLLVKTTRSSGLLNKMNKISLI